MTTASISHPTITARPRTAPACIDDVGTPAGVWVRQRIGASTRVRDGLNPSGPNAPLARCAR